MSDQELNRLVEALEATLSPQKNIREDAASYLMQYANHEGYLAMLVHLICDESRHIHVRTASASQLKLLVKNRWDLQSKRAEPIAVNYVELPEAEKQPIRTSILDCLMIPYRPIQNLAEDALAHIISLEFPNKWPNLLDSVLQGLYSDNQQHVCACLIVLRNIFSNVEPSDPNSDRLVIVSGVADVTLPVLKNLMDYLLNNDSELSQQMQVIVLKIFWAATMYGFPHILDNIEELDTWMKFLMQVYDTPVGVDLSKLDEHHRNKALWFVSKKWVIHLWIRWAGRYLGTKKQIYRSESETTVEAFSAKYPATFLEHIFISLDSIAQGNLWFPPKLLTQVLDFLGVAVSKFSLWMTIKPHAWDLIKGIMIPVIQFGENELSMFECEPEAYIALQHDPGEDSSVPRFPALTFILSLARYRGDEFMQGIFSLLVNDIFQPYLSSPLESRNYALKYAGYEILVSLARLYKETEGYAENLEQLIVSFVFPDLVDDIPPWLKAKACLVVSKFAAIKWSDIQYVSDAVTGIIKIFLESAELPTVADASVALFDFICQDKARPIIGPMVPELIEKYLSLISILDSDAVVSSLQYLIRYFPSTAKKCALRLISDLSKAFFRAHTNANRSDTFGDDTLEDNAFLAASQTIRAIHTLCRAVRRSPLLHQLEPFVLPILDISLGSSSSYLEDGLALMTEITYFMPPPFSDDLWNMFHKLAKAYMTFAPDYMQTMLPSFDNFIARDKERFLSDPIYLNTICEFATKYFMDDHYPEIDMLPLTRVFEVILLECPGSVDHIVDPLIKLTVDRMGFQHITTPFKVCLLEVILNCFWYNASLTVQSLNRHGFTEHVLSELFNLIIAEEFTRVYDKKTASLGIGALLRLPFGELPPYVQNKFQQIVVTWMQLTQFSEDQRIQEMEDHDEDDEEWGEDEDNTILEDDERDGDDWGAPLEDLEDDDSVDEAELQAAIAAIRASDQADDVELEQESMANYADITGTHANLKDTEDVPDNFGIVPLDENTVEASIGNRWTLQGQEHSSQLPTENIHEVVFLAETLDNLDPSIKDMLIANFSADQKDLYDHLNEVATLKVQGQMALEQENNELLEYYESIHNANTH